MQKEQETTFWSKLLPLTIKYAIENNEFYSQSFYGVNPECVRNPEALQQLPIVTRSMLRCAGRRAISNGLTCAAIQNTSGTTGEILFLHRSVEEFSFIRDFFGEILSRNKKNGPRSIVLVLDTTGHGVNTPVPSSEFIIQSDISSIRDIERAIAYLSREYDIGGVESRVSAVVGAVSQINLLTEFLVSKNLRHLMDVIETISLTSDYLSPANRSWLEACWKSANVIDRYSMAECFGGATYCSDCKAFHFDPVIVPELVKPYEYSASSVTTGQLVVTALYPFVQMQPLIRYLTDDLFELIQSGCAHPSYKYLGRIGHSLFDPLDKTVVLIPGSHLYASLDETPGVARKGTLGSARGSFAGKPLMQGYWSTHREKRNLTIKVAVDDQADPEMVVSDFTTHLRKRCTALDQMINAEIAELSVKAVRMDENEAGTFSRDSHLWTCFPIQAATSS